jgi:DNA polymerase
LRQKGKVAELALGYRGGPGAMEKMGALKQGLTKKELPGIVKAWREASPNVVKLWDETERAAIQAVRNPMKKIPFGVRCHFFTAKAAGMDYLFMALPSGRKIAYPEPRLEKMLTWKIETKVVLPDGTEDVELSWKKMLNPTAEQIATIRRKHPDAKLKDALTFYGQLPKTVNWGRVATHGGVLVENLCQGVCADFMAHGAINASRAGYEICALIHDEALAYYHPEKGQSLEEFVAMLTKLPDWAEGMPLKAEGDVVKFYKK